MGKIKKALIKLSKKATGKDLTNEDSIGDVVNFMADNYEGGSSTMMLDLDKIKELNPDYHGVIDINTVGCDAAKLFEYIKNGGFLPVRTTVHDEETGDRPYILYLNQGPYIVDQHTFDLFYDLPYGGNQLYVKVSDIAIPCAKFMDSGELDPDDPTETQNTFTCNMTYDEIVQMYEEGNVLFVVIPDKDTDIDNIAGEFIAAEKSGNSYLFAMDPTGSEGHFGISWDNTNQKFILWNGSSRPV